MKLALRTAVIVVLTYVYLRLIYLSVRELQASRLRSRQTPPVYLDIVG